MLILCPSHAPYTAHHYRILFPYLSGGDENISRFGHSKAEGYSDPDDYVSIESGAYNTLSELLTLNFLICSELPN